MIPAYGTWYLTGIVEGGGILTPFAIRTTNFSSRSSSPGSLSLQVGCFDELFVACTGVLPSTFMTFLSLDPSIGVGDEPTGVILIFLGSIDETFFRKNGVPSKNLLPGRFLVRPTH